MCQGMTESQIHTENEDEIVNSKNIDMGKKKKNSSNLLWIQALV